MQCSNAYVGCSGQSYLRCTCVVQGDSSIYPTEPFLPFCMMNQLHVNALAVLHISTLLMIVLYDLKATLRVRVETLPRPIPIPSSNHHHLMKPTVLRRLWLIKAPYPRPIRNIMENLLVSRFFGPPRNTHGNHCPNSSLISPTRLLNMPPGSISSATGTGPRYATWR